MLKGIWGVEDHHVVPFLDAALFSADREWSAPPIQELLKHVRQALSNHQPLVMRLLLQPEPFDHTDIPSATLRLASGAGSWLYPTNWHVSR
ncbi:hypothetical protein D3C84_1129920 [compost metagenome]